MTTPRCVRGFKRNTFLLVNSSFTGAEQSEDSLITFATELGASHALYAKEYLRTNTGAVPLTLTTPTTSYSSGIVSGNYGTASYSGTTYGTETSSLVIP